MKKYLVLLLVCLLIFAAVSKIVAKKFYQPDVSFPAKSLFITKFDFGPNGGNIRVHVM